MVPTKTCWFQFNLNFSFIHLNNWWKFQVLYSFVQNVEFLFNKNSNSNKRFKKTLQIKYQVEPIFWSVTCKDLNSSTRKGITGKTNFVFVQYTPSLFSEPKSRYIIKLSDNLVQPHYWWDIHYVWILSLYTHNSTSHLLLKDFLFTVLQPFGSTVLNIVLSLSISTVLYTKPPHMSIAIFQLFTLNL